MNYEDRVTKAAVEAAIAGSIVFGTYTGDGTAERTIELGFTPKALYVQTMDGRTYNHNGTNGVQYYCGGLVTPECPIIDKSARIALEITDGGFIVRQRLYDTGTQFHSTNEGGTTYYYAALK